MATLDANQSDVVLSLGELDPTLDDSAFLSRSANRVRVLDAIDERPRTRDGLKDLTDSSRFTLSRIPADFEDRRWISRTGTRYGTTGEGRVVATAYSALLTNPDVADALDGTSGWLQVDQFDIDLAHLDWAEMILSSMPVDGPGTASCVVSIEALRSSSRAWWTEPR